jgi:hypothetical protein
VPRAVFKTLEIIADRFSRKAGRAAGTLLLSALTACSACSLRSGPVVSARSLENAPQTRPKMIRRAIVSPAADLQACYRPLGPRLGLIQIRSASDWEKLRAAAPELGPCPDLSQGMVIGLLCHAGQPVNGRWPIHLQAIRNYQGAGFATGEFEGGTYLPDDTTYIEIAQFTDLRGVLMVDIDGTRFYPEEYAK